MNHLIKSVPVERITPGDGQYFFGYYDLQPFNKSETLHLTHNTSFRNRLQVKGDVADFGVIDVNTKKYEKLGETKAWNFQQGAMLQWNSLNPDTEIIYNDIKDGQYCGVVMDITNGKKRYLDRPVANVSKDGRYAVNINMARLYNFRPGYGYAWIEDEFYYENHSADDGIFITDMQTGKSKLVLSMQEIWELSKDFFGKDEKMVINHITFNTNGTRFLALARNFPPKGEDHSTAIITANRDGSDIYILSDYGFQSHYWWLNEKEVIFFSDGKELSCSRGWANNYILKDKTHEGTMQAEGFFTKDNHMSFNEGNRLMITDTYPDDDKMQTLRLYSPEKDTVVDLGRFYSMPYSIVDVRCDLHPRWNRSANTVTFDSTHEGFRGIYRINLDDCVLNELFN